MTRVFFQGTYLSMERRFRNPATVLARTMKVEVFGNMHRQLVPNNERGWR